MQEWRSHSRKIRPREKLNLVSFKLFIVSVCSYLIFSHSPHSKIANFEEGNLIFGKFNVMNNGVMAILFIYSLHIKHVF